MAFAVKDAAVKNTGELPDAASTTVDVAALDLGHGSHGDFVASAEFKLSAPAVNTTMVPNTKTITYSVIHSDNADLSSPDVLIASCIVQTGAGGAGAAAADYTFRVPVDVKRYLGARAVSGADVTDSSAVSLTLEALFGG